MSTIWTPSGERPIRREEPAAPAAPEPEPTRRPPADDQELTPEEAAALQAQVQRELLEAPAAVVVANHCIGLFQLAALHLDQEQPRLVEARLAIDAMAAVVEGLGSRLGENERPLRDALTNLQMAFLEVQRRAGGPDAGASGYPFSTAADGRSPVVARSTASHRPRWPAATENVTRAPTAMVRDPSAMLVQWKGSSRPSSERTVPSPRCASKAATLPAAVISGRSWRGPARRGRTRRRP